MIHQPTSKKRIEKVVTATYKQWICLYSSMERTPQETPNFPKNSWNQKNPSRLGVPKFFQQFCEIFGDKLIQKIAKNNSQQKPKMILDNF